MNTRRRPTRHLLVTCLLGVIAFASFTEPGLSQIGIGIGGGSDNDGFNIDIFQAGKTIKSAVEAIAAGVAESGMAA